MNLSAHFTLEEFTRSDTAARLGIDNTPPPEIARTLVDTAMCMEEVRRIINTPITVTSGYRCPTLNRHIGSKDSSQHTKGEAVDFIAPPLTPHDICMKLIAGKLYFDQLILEHDWVHISFAPLSNRHQALTLDPKTGIVTPGINHDT